MALTVIDPATEEPIAELAAAGSRRPTRPFLARARPIPGPVETPLLLRLFEDDPGAYERRRVHLPRGRLAKGREIANGAVFLASDDSSYVTGATFLVDGGLAAAYVTPE